MTRTRWLNEEEQRAWRSVMAMQEGLTEFIDRQLRSRCGLSHADFQVLAHLSEAPEGTLRALQLGRLLRWEKSRLSQHLARMQARGLVSRRRCPHDLRGLEVSITGQGRELIGRAAAQHVTDVRYAVVDNLSTSELATLADTADKVLARLAAAGPENL